MATEKQINYAMALLKRNGYRTDYMDASFKALGARMKERSGRVRDWLSEMDKSRISDLISALAN